MTITCTMPVIGSPTLRERKPASNSQRRILRVGNPRIPFTPQAKLKFSRSNYYQPVTTAPILPSRARISSGVSSSSMRVMCWPGTTTSPINRLVMSSLIVSFEVSWPSLVAAAAASLMADGLGKRNS